MITCINAQKNISFLILSSRTALFVFVCVSPSIWNALPPPQKYLVCSDWSAHPRLSQHSSSCLGWTWLCFQLSVSLCRGCCQNWGHGDTVWCQEVMELKAGLEAFQALKEQSGAPICVAFWLSRPHAFTRTYTTNKKQIKTKHEKSIKIIVESVKISSV